MAIGQILGILRQKKVVVSDQMPCRSDGSRRDQYLSNPLHVQSFHFSATTSHLETSESLSTTRTKPIIPVALLVFQVSK